MKLLSVLFWKLLLDWVSSLNKGDDKKHEDIKKKITEERRKAKEWEERYLRWEFRKK